MATVTLGSIKFNWKGAYNSSTAYAVDDVVSSSGNSYVCIQAHTNQAVGNATAYWNIMSSAGTNGTNGTDVGTTITTQGDILYRDGSGLQRLAAGTAGQVLKTGGSGANPSWTTVSGDLSASGATQSVWKQVFTSAFSTNNTTYTDTGMNLAIPTLSANTDFIVMITEARRENTWNQTGGLHQYSTDNGSNWNELNKTMEEYDTGNQNYPETNTYQTHTSPYYLSFTSGQTPRFKVQGRRFGGSNSYFLNYSHDKSSIIAIKVTP